MLPIPQANSSSQGLKKSGGVGEIMTIEYQTTLTNYTIALWQEALPKANAARKGPILYRESIFGWWKPECVSNSTTQEPRQARIPGSSGRFSSMVST
jgi:hypothetical protein